MRFSLHARAKEHFVQKHYGDGIEFIIASSQSKKDEVIDVLKEVYKCKYSEILFIDDSEENVSRFRIKGCVAAMPDELI